MLKKFLVFILALVFCVPFAYSIKIHHEMWIEDVYEPTLLEDFKVFSNEEALNGKKYIEMGEFIGNLAPLKKEACARGADAFIQSKKQSFQFGVFHTGMKHPYIAIKFLPFDNSKAEADWKYLTQDLTEKEKLKLKIKLWENSMKKPGKKSLIELAVISGDSKIVKRAKAKLETK